VTKKIIRKLLRGEDYRIEIVGLIDASFLQYSVDFFKAVVNAKLTDKRIDADWYKKTFLDETLDPADIAIHAGLNKKTISNMYNSAARQVVIEASNDHYNLLLSSINDLIVGEPDLEINLSIKFGGVSVELNLSESLVVINAIAVKRAALRGGLWSTAGKRVEKPLMITMCELYGVAPENYSVRASSSKRAQEIEDLGFEREIDFYLISGENKVENKCEVKLMGKGNPESADAVIARDSKVFVADKLSDLNKSQLDHRGVLWVELRSANGFRRFEEVLKVLQIPHTPPPSTILEAQLDSAFQVAF
jgi:hypothetical protein